MVDTIAILGGAFNPPTQAHLDLAQACATQLPVSRLLLVPTGNPVHKRLDGDPPARLRLEMCEAFAALVSGVPCEVWPGEMLDPRPSETVLTLRRLHRPRQRIVLVLGADQAATLPEWGEPHEIARRADIAVAPRPGTRRQAVHDALARIGARPPIWIDLHNGSARDVSSTMIRAKVRDRGPLTGLVPDPVTAIIARERLYTEIAPPAPRILASTGASPARCA